MLLRDITTDMRKDEVVYLLDAQLQALWQMHRGAMAAQGAAQAHSGSCEPMMGPWRWHYHAAVSAEPSTTATDPLRSSWPATAGASS